MDTLDNDELLIFNKIKKSIYNNTYYQKNKKFLITAQKFCEVCNKLVNRIYFCKHCKTKRHLKNFIQK